MFETLGTVVPSHPHEDFLKSLPLFPVRDPQGHKGTYGRLLLLGGSVGMSGAICLAGGAALVAGAGLVQLAVPMPILGIVASFAPEYMTYSLSATATGAICEQAQNELPELMNKTSSAVLGPGLGRARETSFFVRHVVRQLPVPLVVDADALFALTRFNGRTHKEERTLNSAPRIFTPHPGEFAQWTGLPIPVGDEARIQAALQFVQENRRRFVAAETDSFILVLKGPRTVITDGNEVFINETGNAGLATGGTGDVLTGLLGALLAQRFSPLVAARLAVALHGLAADCAATQLPLESITATDIIRYFPSALNFLRQVQNAPGI